ncbi:MAG: hypothetical protein GY830_07930 [Bacteroidetes bacterium]|nr:hypothetical protein [Bacteroidota bacterium]
MKIEKNIFNKNRELIAKILQESMKVPYYKKLYEKNSIDINKIKTYEDFKKFPFTTKKNCQMNISEFVSETIFNEGFDLSIYENIKDPKEKMKYTRKYKLMLYRTSGSTGMPLSIFKNFKDINKSFFLLNMYRKKIWPDIFEHPYIWIWGVNPFISKTAFGNEESFLQIDKYGYVHYLCNYNMEVFDKLLKFIVSNKIKWMVGGSSILAYFGEYIVKYANKLNLDIRYIECHSEHLFDWQKDNIEQAFGIVPRSIYASNEIQFMGATCEMGNMHIFDRNVFVELIKTSKGSYEVVATTLTHDNMPLIRYKTGDCANWLQKDCQCGLKSPAINLKQYRVNDLIKGKDGMFCENWIITDSVYFMKRENILDFGQYQVIQESIDKFIYIIRAENISQNKVEKAKLFLEDYFLNIFGYKVDIDIEIVKDIISNDSTSGKFKYFISKVK